MDYYLKVSPEMGRGLYTGYVGIQKAKLIAQCELLIFDEFDTVLVNQTNLKYYTFKYNDKQDCLVLGDGEIFNHSDTPNVGYKLMTVDDRKVMVFYALRDIAKDEQLFIDYNADIKVDVKSYMGKDMF